MRAIVTIGLLLLGAIGMSQELYMDMFRWPSEHVNGVPEYGYSSQNNTFDLGFNDTTGQVLESYSAPRFSSRHFFVHGWNKDEQGNLLGSTIGVNFDSAMRSLDGRNYAAGTVTLYLVDKLPTIDLQHFRRNEQGQARISIAVAPVTGASTPGRLLLLARSSGAWQTIYDLPIIGAKTDTRIISIKTVTRLRWVIVRNGGSNLNVAATLKVNVDEP